MTLTKSSKDGLLGLTFIVAAAGLYYGVSGYPSAVAAFPKLIALSIFGVFGTLMVIRSGIERRSEGDAPVGDADDPSDMSVQFDARTLLISVAICLSFVGVAYIGFLESMAALAAISCIAFRMRPSHSAVFVVLFCAVLVGFLIGMGIRLPEGPVSGALFSFLT